MRICNLKIFYVLSLRIFEIFIFAVSLAPKKYILPNLKFERLGRKQFTTTLDKTNALVPSNRQLRRPHLMSI